MNFIKYNKIVLLYVYSELAYLLLIYLIAMLTRYEVLKDLRRKGVKDRYLLGVYLRDFENYMITHYGLKIVDTKKNWMPRQVKITIQGKPIKNFAIEDLGLWTGSNQR